MTTVESVEGRFDSMSNPDDSRKRPIATTTVVVTRRAVLQIQEEILRGSIPSFFMREIKVVRLMPISAAAP